MKIRKKAALAAAVFAVAMNLSACAYGPPRGDEETSESSVSENSAHENGENEDTPQEKESDGQ